MTIISLNPIRRKRRALESMLGIFAERNFRAATLQVLADGKLENEWVRTQKAIFVHVPKNAGSSVQEALGIPKEGLRHPPAEAWRRADPEFFDSAYTFAFTRNPWDRLVSCFHFIKNGKDPYNRMVAQIELRRAADFGEFLHMLRRPLWRHQILSRVHFMSQTHYLCDPNGKVLVKRIGRFEDLPDSFAYLTAPLQGEFVLPQSGKAPTRDYRSYFTEDWQVDLVGRIYADDCRNFGYAFA